MSGMYVYMKSTFGEPCCPSHIAKDDIYIVVVYLPNLLLAEVVTPTYTKYMTSTYVMRISSSVYI